MVPLFAITLFVSATLLFLVEPMFAKMVLPLLGGTPAVWNTCMVSFQAALLAGYAYAHLATSFLRPSRQIPVHLALVSLALLCLPITIATGWSPPRDANPTLWLLLLLTVSVGLPFFVISTSAPVLQKWVSRTASPAARDPYFLYAASNSGSIVGLLGYLIALEPHFTLTMQSRITIADAKPGAYDVLVVDAFSSDSIPIHLLTREALRLYMSKLSDRGIPASFHSTADYFRNIL